MNRKQRRAEEKQGQPALQGASPTAQGAFADALRHHRAGQLGDAVACYTRVLALRPDHAEAHNNLGVVLRDQGRPDEAVASFRRALALRPDYPEAHSNLGAALGAQGRLDEAAGHFGRAFALRPDYPEAYNTLGLVLRDNGRPDAAAAFFDRALALRPDHPGYYNNLGVVLGSLERLDEAVACHRQALALRPDYPEAHNNLGVALKSQGHFDEAIACFDRALALRPDYPEAHNNLGVALKTQRRLDGAIASFRRALALRPDYPEAHNNLAGALLTLGDMAAGWEGYEWRWKTPLLVEAHRGFARPQWRGEAAAGRTLLVHAEQGFGDTLQFCRYAPLAAARGLRVIMEVQTPLVRLLRGIAGVDLVVERGSELPSFDLHCPLLSMPLALATTLATIPGDIPYLRADAAQVTSWRTRLAAVAGPGLRVGLAWAGNPGMEADRRRSLAPHRLAPLFGVPGVRWFSLQKGGPPAPQGIPLTDFMGEMGDFADTAALVANLDLVVSVDTAVAHLGAALGKPVWVLNRFDACWRWLDGRRDSPWYPTLRLYHQPRHGDWNPMLAEVARDLRVLAGA